VFVVQSVYALYPITRGRGHLKLMWW